MRNPSLHHALQGLAAAASAHLGSEVADGADVPFELVERRGGRASLYSYSPLTADFVRTRMGALGRLDAYSEAARVMRDVGGLDTYLRSRGERRLPADPDERVDAALRCWLTRLWEDRADFEVAAERFDVAYGELEATVYATRWLVCAAVPVVGLLIESERIALGDGVWLIRADGREDLPADAAWGADADAAAGPAVVLLELEARPESPVSVARLRSLLAELRTALRLYDAEPLGLAPVGWVREDMGVWQLLSLGGGGRDDGRLVLVADQEDELRAFVNLVRRRRPRSGSLAWALHRFELACERPDPLDGLTDALLAGRALLEPEGPSSGRLAQRLAVICAEPDDRALLAERVAHAISLERARIAGLRPAVADPAELALELVDDLRAVLRDVICGHLEPDLVALADRLLSPPAPVAPAAAVDDDGDDGDDDEFDDDLEDDDTLVGPAAGVGGGVGEASAPANHAAPVGFWPAPPGLPR